MNVNVLFELIGCVNGMTSN